MVRRGRCHGEAINLGRSAAARRHTKAEHLRDEMREHQRLRELGVLSEGDYEVSKARILGQHSPALG